MLRLLASQLIAFVTGFVEALSQIWTGPFCTCVADC